MRIVSGTGFSPAVGQLVGTDRKKFIVLETSDNCLKQAKFIILETQLVYKWHKLAYSNINLFIDV